MNSTAEQPQTMEVTNLPSDAISEVAFSPQNDYLAASSWDNSVRVWEVLSNGSTNPKAMINHEGPALCCAWSKDGTKLVSGGADKAGRMLDLTTGQSQQVAQHDEPIKSVRLFEAGGAPILVTGSWDKTVKYWDLRSPTPIGTVPLSDRVYTMDVLYPLMVVATADMKVHIFNLNNPNTIYKTQSTPLKWQTRCIACFPAYGVSGVGYAIGSIEGRVGIQYVDTKDGDSANFAFKCHRDNTNQHVFAINDISFHPIHNTFVTAGSDGTFCYWDKDAKQRLKHFTNVGGPITSTAFNRSGSILAYAISYDWSKGYIGATGQVPNKIVLQAVKEDDMKPRNPKTRK